MAQVETDRDADGVCPDQRARELPAPPELTCGQGEQPEERHKGAEARVGAPMPGTRAGPLAGLRGMAGRPALSGRGARPLRSAYPLLKVLSKVLEGFRQRPCGQVCALERPFWRLREDRMETAGRSLGWVDVQRQARAEGKEGQTVRLRGGGRAWAGLEVGSEGRGLRGHGVTPGAGWARDGLAREGWGASPSWTWRWTSGLLATHILTGGGEGEAETPARGAGASWWRRSVAHPGVLTS